MFDKLAKGSKAEMALELLYLSEPDQVEPPRYIVEGLQWLEENIKERNVDAILAEPVEEKDA